jgi:hypothetical protein
MLIESSEVSHKAHEQMRCLWKMSVEKWLRANGQHQKSKILWMIWFLEDSKLKLSQICGGFFLFVRSDFRICVKICRK